jgi:hypothetical protein
MLAAAAGLMAVVIVQIALHTMAQAEVAPMVAAEAVWGTLATDPVFPTTEWLGRLILAAAAAVQQEAMLPLAGLELLSFVGPVLARQQQQQLARQHTLHALVATEFTSLQVQGA